MATLGHHELAEKLSALPRGSGQRIAKKYKIHQSRISSVHPGGKMPNRELAGIFLAEFGIAWDSWDKPAPRRKATRKSA